MSPSKFKSKLVYLLLLVGGGLVAIGLIGYLNLQNIKRDMDTLYYGSLLPLGELHGITDTYRSKLETTVYRWNNGMISDDEAAETITQALNHIDHLWANYLSRHKRPDERAYVDYTETKITAIKRYFEQVRDIVLSPSRAHELSLNTLTENVELLHSTIERLIAYESAAARYEHSVLKAHYDNALMQLVLFLGVVLLLVMGLAWKIFTRIEIQQHQLVASAETLKHLNFKLEQASYTDSLTALYNRRYFNLLHEREFKRALRNEQPFVFMMLDIDFFKQYNDTYGHIQGDQTLQAVAKVLKSTLQRPGDYPFRLGGEEFGVIIADTDCQNARAMGERIRAAVEALQIEHKGSKVSRTVSISIGGICVVPTIHMNEEAIIHAADTNLYAAKERGRNQVVFSNKL